jgi:Flp pilus assembly protein CpaB
MSPVSLTVSRRLPLVILLLLLASGGCKRSAPPAPETIEILVASRDLAVGTDLTIQGTPKYVTRKAVVKDNLPPRFVTDEGELIGKRLSRQVKKGEPLDPANLVSPPRYTPPPGRVIASVDCDITAVGGITTGAQAHISTTITDRGRPTPVTLVVYLPVIATTPKSDDVITLSFAVDATQKRILDLATSRGLVLRVQRASPYHGAACDLASSDTLIRVLKSLPEPGSLPIAPAPRVKGSPRLPDGLQAMALGVPIRDGFVAPGWHLDIIALYQDGGKLDAFLLVEDVLVLAVDKESLGNGPRVDVPTVPMTLAVDETQAVLLTLAEKSGCRLKALRRWEGKRRTLTKDDYAKSIEYFRNAMAEDKPEVAPAPRVRVFGALTLPEGLDIMTLPVPEGGGAVAGFVTPGSRVDVIATLARGGKVEAFPLVDDVMVIAVDTVLVRQPEEKMKHTLTLAVDRDQALLLVLAQERGCRLDMLLRAPGKPATTTKDDYKERLQFVQGLPEVAPPPRVKRKVLRLPEGADLYSVGGVLGAGNEFPVPGDRVDLVATRPGDRESLPVLDDVLVLAVNQQLPYPGSDKDHMLSFAVTLDQALILQRIDKLQWELRVRPRDPGTPAAQVDYKKRLKFFQELREVAPAPRMKGE